jgi:hypothetical protein
MKYKFIFSILLLLITTINVFSKANENIIKPKNKRIIQAYGFILGQNYSLDKINTEYPQLKSQIVIARLEFNSTFGKAIDSLKSYLINLNGEVKFNEFEKKLKIEIIKLFGVQLITEKIAISYLEEVKSRAKGNIPTPVLETLLTFQFYDNPEQEYLLGFTNVFKTKGHPKSNNTNWSIRVPKSWKSEEAERPNIIQKFTSDYGSGFQNIMIMAVEFNPNLKSNKINDFFSKENMMKFIPKEAKFISFSNIKIENNTGGMLEYEITTERLDLRLKLRVVDFMFVNRNKLYILKGNVGSENIDCELLPLMEKFLPLYRLVANSIVLIEP